MSDLLETILDSISDRVATLDHDWRYIYLNAAALDGLRLTAAEVLGKPVSAIYPDIDGLPVMNAMQKAKEERAVQRIRHYFPQFAIWLDTSIHPSDKGITLISTDVTATVETEDALVRSEARYNALADASHGLWTFKAGESPFVTSPVQPWLQSITGITPGQSWVVFIHPDEIDEALQAWKQAEADEDIFDTRLRVRNKAGGYSHVHLRVAPIFNRAGILVEWAGTLTDVSDQGQAEMARARLAAIVESSEDAVVSKNIDGIIESWNEGAERLFGFTAEEIIGQPITRIIPENRLHEEADIIARLRRGERLEHFETRRRRKDGREVDISVTISPIYNKNGRIVGASKIARDISGFVEVRNKAKELVEQLVDRSRRLEGLSKASQSINAVLDQKTIMRKLIEAGRFLTQADFGTSGLLQDGRMIFDEYHFDTGTIDHHVEFSVDDEIGIVSWVMRNRRPYIGPDGDPLLRPDLKQRFGITSTVCVPIIDRSGALLACFEMHNKRGGPFTDDDVTVLQGIAAAAAIALENARLLDQVREADRRKDEFLATLAHELRNPLAPIRNALNILEMQVGPKDQQKARMIIERQLGQMVRLVDDLLDVSRITRDKLELRRAVISLKEVIASATEIARPTIEAAGHILSIDLPFDPIWINGDMTRLAQIFSNLMNNAAKYTPDKGRIAVAVARKDDQVEISVSDNGIGIEKPMLSQVFDMFVQTDMSLEKAQGGLGIGLTLVKRLVTLHGGTVRAESEGPGQGSRFVVTLPAAEAPGAETILPETDEFTPDPDGHKMLKVMVVDDNMASAQTMAWMIELLGHETQMAHEGQQAIRAARDFRPDLILLDIGLPGMNGYDVCRALQAEPELKHTVFAAQTGWGQEEHKKRSAEAGFHHHLVKPVSLDMLKEIIARIEADRAASPA